MISVENFYWFLYQHLGKPSGIDCWYFWPWGTKQQLIRHEWEVWQPRREHHALFYFDQEPIWDDDFGLYDQKVGEAASHRLCRLLANSEHSDLKQTICDRRDMLDWYYFYHGFAALDWFRDAQYIEQDLEPTYPFLDLNHLVTHERSYRMVLTALLAQQGVLDRGSWSFHGDAAQCRREIQDPNTRLTEASRNLVHHWLHTQPPLPRQVGHGKIDATSSAHFGHHELSLWQQSMLHVVNETVFYPEKLHLTEKIFKPIVARRPFVLAAAPGNLEYLRSYGFQTFGAWIDESYDLETSPDLRLAAIAREISRLARCTMPQLRAMLVDMAPTLRHNRQHFFGDFRRIIADELVTNFDRCIRIWNNGRVDDRSVTTAANLDQTRRLLAGQ